MFDKTDITPETFYLMNSVTGKVIGALPNPVIVKDDGEVEPMTGDFSFTCEIKGNKYEKRMFLVAYPICVYIMRFLEWLDDTAYKRSKVYCKKCCELEKAVWAIEDILSD